MSKKQEIAVLVIIAAICVAICCLTGIFSKDVSGKYVEIKIDGEIYYFDSIGIDKELDIRTDYGYNHVVISDGTVYVSEADCRDYTCMNVGHIQYDGDVIICLPHRLSISVVDRREDE